jgi:hypothetical protein
LSAREMVAVDTPATRATSSTVGLRLTFGDEGGKGGLEANADLGFETRRQASQPKGARPHRPTDSAYIHP